jgi:hypothetical protein
MAKWKLLSRLKSKDEREKGEEFQQGESTEVMEPEKPILAEQSETLYAVSSASKKSSSTKRTNTSPSDQRIWRDVNAIEENVDYIEKNKAKTPVSELDKTVDKLLAKRKKK